MAGSTSQLPAEHKTGSIIFELPRKYWYLDFVVVAALVIVAYAVIFLFHLLPSTCQFADLPAPDSRQRQRPSTRSGPPAGWKMAALPLCTCSRAFCSPGSGSRTIQDSKKRLLYRGPWLLAVRLLVRLKVAQLGCVAALCVPLHSLLTQGSVGGAELAVTSLLFVGCAIVSTSLFYFSRRFIGELALVTTGQQQNLCISTLDFWGNRQDIVVRLEDVVPILDVSQAQKAQLAQQVFVPLRIASDRQYLLSLRHGSLADRTALFSILGERDGRAG